MYIDDFTFTNFRPAAVRSLESEMLRRLLLSFEDSWEVPRPPGIFFRVESAKPFWCRSNPVELRNSGCQVDAQINKTQILSKINIE